MSGMEGRCIDRGGREAEAGDAGTSTVRFPGDDPFPGAVEDAAAETPPPFPCE
jgi:hypothetical protein